MNPDSFHAHLDMCTQCRDNPFALCPVGEELANSYGDPTYLSCDSVHVPSGVGPTSKECEISESERYR